MLPPTRRSLPLLSQTFGARFAADGRLTGSEVVQTIACDQAANTCSIPVPAPGAALVFVSAGAQAGADAAGATQTFATTAATRAGGGVVGVDPTSLARSNGERPNHLLGTSKGGTATGEGEGEPAGFWEATLWTFLRGVLTCKDC